MQRFASRRLETSDVNNIVIRVLVAALCPLVLLAGPAHADQFTLPDGKDALVGEAFAVQARADDTLLDIARRYGVGYNEIEGANPGVDMWLPGDGTEVLVPRLYVLPDAPREGLVLNVPEMRLYYYPEGEADRVYTHPVSIGRQDWQTPLGLTRIVAKVKDPTWYPPESIRAEHAAEGDPLPRAVPPGPDNPLGGYALRLGIPGYLIHSTNKPFGIGLRASHGCVRMYPEDMVSLFGMIPVNASVRLVNQPVKAGWRGDTLYLEVHSPLAEDVEMQAGLLDRAFARVQALTASRPVTIDTRALHRAVEEQTGMPVAVAHAVEKTTIRASADW